MKRLRLVLYGYFMLTCLMPVLAGCSNDQDKAGVVARVNGVPIYLEDVEAGHDFYFFEWSDPLPPTAQEMKNRYGQVLLDFILIELMKAEFDVRTLTMLQDEVRRVEDEIREDYPDGQFERVLTEEYIDLQYWRTRIGHKLLWEEFVKKVLMPGIQVELDEITDYYYANIHDFYIPDRLVYFYLGAPERDMLEYALEKLQSGHDLDGIRQELGNVHLARYEVRVDQLSLNMSEELQSLEEGQAGEIKEEGLHGFSVFYLLEKKEEQLLKPHQVYKLIEEIIINKKLVSSFNMWLAETLEKSKIEINRAMIEHLDAGQKG